jgi:hypothetical protein
VVAIALQVVTLVTKEGCSLCKKVEEVLSSYASTRHYQLELRSLEEDPELYRKYVLRIPVVVMGGAEVFEAKDMDLAGLWKRELERKVAGPAPS